MQLPAPSHIEITWQVAGVLTGILLAVTKWMANYVRNTVNASNGVLESKLRVAAVEDRAVLIKELNGTYQRKALCEAMMAEKDHITAIAVAEATRTTIAGEVERRLKRLEAEENESG